MPAKKSAGARFEPASDQSLLVYFGEQITLEANENVRRLLHLLEQEPIPGVDNLHPAYCSLLVKFAALKWRHQDRKSTRLNSSHGYISYAVFCLKKKKKIKIDHVVLQSDNHDLEDGVKASHQTQTRESVPIVDPFCVHVQLYCSDALVSAVYDLP